VLRVHFAPALVAERARTGAHPSLFARRQCDLLRDLFSPFRRCRLDPAWLAWRDGTVPNVARTIYDGRAFERLPVLAAALEESGCTDADLLRHCRQPGEHARGCWAVDEVLGMS
jgi:hypothetical protein